MRVVCAWCQHESRPALLREVEPLADATETHGICEAHHLQVMRLLLGAAADAAVDPTPVTRVQSWAQATPSIVAAPLALLVAEIERLEARCRALDAERAHLASEVSWLRDEVGRLRLEHDELASWRRDAARVASTLLDQVLERTLHPLHDVVARLRAPLRPGDRGRVDRRDDSL